MQYLRATIHLSLIVGSDGSGNLVWSIDASFTVHTDMKGHSGYCLSLGIGSPVSGSSTQKVNTQSTTESELVAVDDAIGYMEWTSLYSKDQVKDYPNEHPLKKLGIKNIVIQDKTSSIKLVKGGRRVCGSRARGIRIRYFYAHERVEDGIIIVTYCPTKGMVSDYLSKPLQGRLFRTRNIPMGISEADYITYKVAYAEQKALRAKAVCDIYIYIYI